MFCRSHLAANGGTRRTRIAHQGLALTTDHRPLTTGRRAFTLVELLVVVAIIGILVGMIMPAVNQARESGRKAVCVSNMHNIGVALQAYEAQNRTLPIGSWSHWPSSGSNPPADESGGSMLHFILPYIGEQNLYDLFDWQTVYASGQDQYKRPKPMITNGRIWKSPTSTYAGLPSYMLGTPLYSIPLKVFVCPSDDLHGVYFNGATVYAQSNYVGSVGSKYYWGSGGNPACSCAQLPTTDSWSSWFNTAQTYAQALAKLRTQFNSQTGPFMVHSSATMSPKAGFSALTGTNYIYPAVSFAQIRDGLSSTIMCGEARGTCESDVRGGWANSWNGCALINTSSPMNYDTCDGTNSVCATTPCNASTNWEIDTGFKSAHFGGCNFLFCDGAVHWLTQNIDPVVYQCLGDIDDGQPIPANAYAN